MSQGGVIDGPEFARAGATLAGTLEISDLPRVAEAGCSAAQISFAIRGGTTAQGRPALNVDATGTVVLVCQRCLEPVTVPVAVHSELELAASQEAVDLAQDDIDRVVASRSMSVATLVEDEVILALPMVAKHEQCPARGKDVKRGDERESPFAALAALRTGRRKT